ncbi:hypothetical protein TWF481_010999 [Arthrobotrys musiformis]|uniref:F-box domain-containing protein n=1 Tax=Arthrobotrys musiformis TaxID=47236 RepID=A0AAV9VZ51_9PEZI
MTLPGPRTLSDIYNDPSWPSALHEIFQRVCPPSSTDQSSRNKEFTELWTTCRSVCKMWKNILEYPLLLVGYNDRVPDHATCQNLLTATFRQSTLATVDDELHYCVLPAKWLQKRIIEEVEREFTQEDQEQRNFPQTCLTDFRLMCRTNTALQMYASTPVVRDLRIRSFIREFEATERNALLEKRGFKMKGVDIIRAWDGWYLNAPGGVMVDMLVGFVALAVEIDVLLQNTCTRDIGGTPRPLHIDLDFVMINVSTAKCFRQLTFDIPYRKPQVVVSRGGSGREPCRDLASMLADASDCPQPTLLQRNPPGDGPVEQALNVVEILSEIFFYVGLPKTERARDKIAAFASLSKCLRVCKRWNDIAYGSAKVRKGLFVDKKLSTDDNTNLVVCEPFVQELIRWSELSKWREEGPAAYLKAIGFRDMFFTQPPVKEVSLTFSTIFGTRREWLQIEALGCGPNDHTYWHDESSTLRYKSFNGIKVMGIARILQLVERQLIKGTLLGVAIGVPGCSEESDGLPIWVDFDGLGLQVIRDRTNDMPDSIYHFMTELRGPMNTLMN